MKPAANLREIVKGLWFCQDAKQNRESARKLLRLKFETMTVAHGNPIHPKAREQVATLLGA